MRYLRNLAVLVIAGIVLTGCASINADRGFCAFAGALAGGAIGGGLNDGDRVAGAAAGAAVGGLAGALLCNVKEEAPPVAAPEPTPAPAPVAVDGDSDGDGVPDSRDECPGTAPGTPVDSRGCPTMPTMQDVHFRFDDASLTPAAEQILDGAVDTLKQNSHVRVEIVGHTDSIGSEEYNQKLSERRAESVRTYLESKGIESSRLSASGKGESEPVASNDTPEGRAKNRRVDTTAIEIRTY